MLVGDAILETVDVLEQEVCRLGERANRRRVHVVVALVERDLEAGLLASLPSGGLVGELVALYVAARWEPESQLSVFVQQRRAVVDDVNGGDEVSRRLHTRPTTAARFDVAFGLSNGSIPAHIE